MTEHEDITHIANKDSKPRLTFPSRDDYEDAKEFSESKGDDNRSIKELENIKTYQQLIRELQTIITTTRSSLILETIRNALIKESPEIFFYTYNKHNEKTILPLFKDITESEPSKLPSLFAKLFEYKTTFTIYKAVALSFSDQLNNDANIKKSDINIIKDFISKFHDASYIRNQIINENLPLVKSIINRKFSSHIKQFDDLFQIGSLGLVKGIDYYNPNRNTLPSTYLTMTIIRHIRRYLIHKSQKSFYYQRYLMIERTRESLQNKLNRRPTDEEVKQELKMRDETYERIMKIKDAHVISLDSSEGLQEYQYDKNQQSVLSQVISLENIAEVQKTLLYMYGKQLQVLKILFGIGNTPSCTLDKCGEVLQLTRERVRQIKIKALEHFKLIHQSRKISLTTEDKKNIYRELHEYLLCKQCISLRDKVLARHFGINLKKVTDESQITISNPKSKLEIAKRLNKNIEEIDNMIILAISKFISETETKYHLNNIFSISINIEDNIVKLYDLRFNIDKPMVSFSELLEYTGKSPKELIKQEKMWLSYLKAFDIDYYRKYKFYVRNKLFPNTNLRKNILEISHFLTDIQRKILELKFFSPNYKLASSEMLARIIGIDKKTFLKESKILREKLKFFFKYDATALKHFQLIDNQRLFCKLYDKTNPRTTKIISNLLTLKNYLSTLDEIDKMIVTSRFELKNTDDIFEKIAKNFGEQAEVIKRRYDLAVSDINIKEPQLSIFLNLLLYAEKNPKEAASLKNFFSSLSPEELKLFSLRFSQIGTIYTIRDCARILKITPYKAAKLELKIMNIIKKDYNTFYEYIKNLYLTNSKKYLSLKHYKDKVENFLFITNSICQPILIHSLGLYSLKIKNKIIISKIIHSKRNSTYNYEKLGIDTIKTVIDEPDLQYFLRYDRAYQFSKIPDERLPYIYKNIENFLFHKLKTYKRYKRNILIDSFGLFGNKRLSISEICQKYKISYERAYLIEAKLLDTLTRSIPANLLYGFLQDKIKNDLKDNKNFNVFETLITLLPTFSHTHRNILIKHLGLINSKMLSFRIIANDTKQDASSLHDSQKRLYKKIEKILNISDFKLYICSNTSTQERISSEDCAETLILSELEHQEDSYLFDESLKLTNLEKEVIMFRFFSKPYRTLISETIEHFNLSYQSVLGIERSAIEKLSSILYFDVGEFFMNYIKLSPSIGTSNIDILENSLFLFNNEHQNHLIFNLGLFDHEKCSYDQTAQLLGTTRGICYGIVKKAKEKIKLDSI